MSKTVFLTGAAGFIGAAVAEALLKRGDRVVGVDNLNDYYDVNLKKDRLERIKHLGFSFVHFVNTFPNSIVKHRFKGFEVSNYLRNTRNHERGIHTAQRMEAISTC